MNDVTFLLNAVGEGSTEAAHQLWQAVYAELRRIAGEKMRQEGREVTLQATALVHEAWLRMAGPETPPQTWEGRAHFFAAAAEAMRRILVDQARRRLRRKRGGGAEHVPLEDAVEISGPGGDEKLIQVHESLDALEREDTRKARIVKLRFFAGFTYEEIAVMLELNEKTIRREWTMARTWLFDFIKTAGEMDHLEK